jgi:excisionase family DNA binding protein
MSLLSSLAPDALAELHALIDARVAAALAEREREPQKRWLTAAEAGHYLGCSQRAIYRRIARKRIPPDAVRHSGTRVYVDKVALDAAQERA